jgi:hypothetical protein
MPMLLRLQCIYLCIYLYLFIPRLRETVSCLLYCPVFDTDIKRIICIGVTLKSPVVTIYTTNLTQILRSTHTSEFICFVWISEQTAIISLYNINWLVCITETECVYCAVRTGCLYIIQITGHSMYHQFNIQHFYVLLTQCIYVFCVDLRTNNDYFPIQH